MKFGGKENVGLEEGRKSVAVGELERLEREFKAYSVRIAAMSDGRYRQELIEKIEELDVQLRPYEDPKKAAADKDASETELQQEYKTISAKLSECETRLESQTSTLQDLDNQRNETGIKLHVLSDELSEASAAVDPTSETPHGTRKSALQKLIRTRYTVTLNEYAQARSGLQGQAAELQELLRNQSAYVALIIG